MRVPGNELQIRNPNLPGPIIGDFDEDGDVDCEDLDGHINNIGAAATGPLASLDLNADGFLGPDAAIAHIETLIVTSNGVTGTFFGDMNCDGKVNATGDAFTLVANLNSSMPSYRDGDLNFDGAVTVLGDAFILLAKFGMSNQ